jgi:(E)-2-((N-methylformamido)methylene)succinate hydrolase
VTDLILLHGVGLDHTIWHPLRDALPDVTTHAYDLRGHGAGPDWNGPATLDGFAADLFGYADAQGLDTFALCGFSLGAMIAQWAALSQPARISHLILLSGVYRRTPDQMAAVQLRFKQAEQHGPQVMIDAALERWFPPEFAAEFPEYPHQIRARLEGNNTDQFMRSYRLFAHEGAQIDGRLGEIKVPALVATGGLDTGSTPEMAHKMASEMPNAQCVIFNDAAHMLPMQKPHELARLIKGLLRKETP